jgi:hypothetical protein
MFIYETLSRSVKAWQVGMCLIPAIQEAEIGRIAIGGQPRQKVSETNFNRKAMHGGMCL